MPTRLGEFRAIGSRGRKRPQEIDLAMKIPDCARASIVRLTAFQSAHADYDGDEALAKH